LILILALIGDELRKDPFVLEEFRTDELGHLFAEGRTDARGVLEWEDTYLLRGDDRRHNNEENGNENRFHA